MSDRPPRFERACAELMQAMANFMAALGSELERLESTVAPHSHPAERSAPSVTAQPAAAAPSGVPVGDSLEVSSEKTAPTEVTAPPAALLSNQRWTPERLELLRETYTKGVPLDDILERLNALPSKIAVSKNQIGPMAATKGWQRPPEPALKAPDTWTPERLAAAQPLYERGASMAAIVSAVNALPGPPINPYRVTVCAGAHNWKRGAPPVQPAAAAPVPANAAQIIHWAGERGIVVQARGGLPLDTINAKRKHLGMPPFVLTPSVHGTIA